LPRFLRPITKKAGSPDPFCRVVGSNDAFRALTAGRPAALLPGNRESFLQGCIVPKEFLARAIVETVANKLDIR
jgi:hypothetical protein